MRPTTRHSAMEGATTMTRLTVQGVLLIVLGLLMLFATALQVSALQSQP